MMRSNVQRPLLGSYWYQLIRIYFVCKYGVAHQYKSCAEKNDYGKVAGLLYKYQEWNRQIHYYFNPGGLMSDIKKKKKKMPPRGNICFQC